MALVSPSHHYTALLTQSYFWLKLKNRPKFASHIIFIRKIEITPQKITKKLSARLLGLATSIYQNSTTTSTTATTTTISR